MASPKGPLRALLEQKQQLDPLLDISPSAIVITDRDTNVVAWNPAAEELFGYTAEEAVGRNLDDLVATTNELHEVAVAYSEQALKKDQIRTVTRRTRKDGTLVDVEVRVAPLLANGEAIGMFGIYHDVTELHRQKRFYEALLEVSPAAIVAIDPADNVTLWNRAAERMFGYTADEAVGENVDDLVAANEEIRAEAEQLNRTAEGGQIRMIGRRTRKDGSLVDVELLGAPVMVGDELVGRYAIYLDISELQRRKQYYEALVEVSPEAIVTTDGDDTVTSWNPAAERLFGYTAEEAIGTDIDDLVTRGEDQVREGKAMSRSALEGPTAHRLTQRTRKDGSLVDVDIVGGPVLVGGNLVGKHVFYHDISELQEQKRYFQALVELSPTAIVVTDLQGNVSSWNPAADKLFGYTAEEAIGRNLDDLVATREDLHAEGARYTEAAIRGERVRAFSRRTRKDGSLVDVEIVSEPIVVGQEPLGFLAIYHDVTELQHQKRFFEAVLELSLTAIVTVDEEFHVTSWNPAAEQLFGYTADEAMGRFVDDLVANSPDIREEAAAMNQAGYSGQEAKAIGRRTRKDGSFVDVQIVAGPVYVSGERVGHSVMYNDIGEIQRQKRYYEAVLEVSPTAIVMLTHEGTITSWNPAAERLFGYSPEEAIGQDIDDLVARSDEIREEALRISREGRTTVARTGAITRRTRKDGTLVDVEVAGVPVIVAGEHVGDCVVYHDIGEIQRQKRYYQSVLELSPAAIVTVDENAHVMSWNPAAEKLFGYRPEEAIGQFIDDLVANTPELRLEAATFNEVGFGGEENRAITRRTRKDGSIVDVEIIGTGRMAGEGVEDIVIYHDITEIQRQKQYYEGLIETSPIAIMTVDLNATVTSWNPGAERLLGYSAEEAIGRNIDELVANNDEIRAEAVGVSDRAREGGQVHLVTRRTRKDGSLIDVDVVAAPIFISGETVGYYAMYTDIGELQRQKRYFEALVEVSPVAVVLVDTQNVVTSWNPAAEHLFGYTAEEAVGRYVLDLVALDPSIKEDAEAKSESIRAGESVHGITRRNRKDGSLVDVEILAAPVWVGDQRVGHYILYHDISELQRQKRYYEALVEVSPVAVVLMDNDGIITSWSPAAERLFGYSLEQAIGRNIIDVVGADPEIREEAEGYLRQMQQGEESFHAITRRTRRDGTLVDVEIHTAPVVIGDQRVGFYVLYHDIGPLQKARREAEAATRAKSAFLATMSHEIRTPLNAVIGMTGLLLDTDLVPEQRSYGEVIRTSGDALLAVINEILDFSKIEAGRLDLESRPFGLRQCVESTLELVATAAADKSLDLAYMIDPRTPASIVGDFTRLRQILLNLLNNAVKFTPQGEVVLRVDATPLGTAAPDGGPARYEIHFSVQDTGIGVPEDRMDRLFEAFTQVDASTTRRYGGTGLGLAISKRLAEEMGGRLWAESRVGEGSRFHATITAEAASGPMATEELEATPELGGKRVLIVDDNATNREILRRQAESWQMVAVEAESPAKALEYVRRGDPFDIAILDMQMPDMDGTALAEEIRRHRDADALPLVMLTSLGRRDPSPAGAEFAAFLTKPIRPSQLYDVLIGIFAPRLAPQRVSRPKPAAVARPAEHPQLRILLAEDNAVNQRVGLLLLEKLGYRADVAADGREALEALERQPYDVVLMDVQMPEMDGLEATRNILERWPGPDRPRIIAMTAGATEADREACLAAGMDDYVSKPIRREELAAALARSIPAGGGDEVRNGSGKVRSSEQNVGSRGVNVRSSGQVTIDMQGLNRLRETVGGEEALQEVMTTFIDDTERVLAALRSDVGAGRASEVRRHAHSLKSTASSFGATGLSELCRRLEELGLAGDLDGAAALVEDIATEFARVREALRPESSR